MGHCDGVGCHWSKEGGKFALGREQLHMTLSLPLYRGYGSDDILASLTGSAYIVWFFRALGAKIGRNVSIFAGGRTGFLSELDLVEVRCLLLLASLCPEIITAWR
jgi:hypothetical protein